VYFPVFRLRIADARQLSPFRFLAPQRGELAGKAVDESLAGSPFRSGPAEVWSCADSSNGTNIGSLSITLDLSPVLIVAKFIAPDLT
jgi:hypothetical protein